MSIEEALKKFLNRNDIREALKNDNLGIVYQELEYNKDHLDVTDLTEFLYNCGIEAYRYLREIPRESYYGCDEWVKEDKLIINKAIKINSAAFVYNPYKKIYIGNQVEYIGSRAFQNSTYLTEIEFQDGCQAEICERAFLKCGLEGKISEVHLPITIKSLGFKAFDEWVKIYLPKDSKTNIDNSLIEQIYFE